MKTVTEIIGGAQGLLDISFDLQNCFEEYLNEQQKTFLHMLRCIEKYIDLPERRYLGTGRRPYRYMPFLRSHFAKSFFHIATTSKLIERLQADPNLRLLCGFNKVPGKASFSRALGFLVKQDMLNGILEKLARETFKDKVVYHVCRDSTAIHAREKAEKKPKKTPQTTPKKRGRPRKTDEKQPTEIERQLTEEPCCSLERLHKKCTLGFKQNSNSQFTFWKGYKLHLDVSV